MQLCMLAGPICRMRRKFFRRHEFNGTALSKFVRKNHHILAASVSGGRRDQTFKSSRATSATNCLSPRLLSRNLNGMPFLFCKLIEAESQFSPHFDIRQIQQSPQFQFRARHHTGPDIVVLEPELSEFLIALLCRGNGIRRHVYCLDAGRIPSASIVPGPVARNEVDFVGVLNSRRSKSSGREFDRQWQAIEDAIKQFLDFGRFLAQRSRSL